jgi:hypothetical protein
MSCFSNHEVLGHSDWSRFGICGASLTHAINIDVPLFIASNSF